MSPFGKSPDRGKFPVFQEKIYVFRFPLRPCFRLVFGKYCYLQFRKTNIRRGVLYPLYDVRGFRHSRSNFRCHKLQQSSHLVEILPKVDGPAWLRLEKKEQEQLENLLICIVAATWIFSFGMAMQVSFFSSESPTYVMVLMVSSVFSIMMSIYTATFLKFFEIKLLLIFLTKAFDDIKFALNAVLYLEKLKFVTFEQYLRNPNYKEKPLRKTLKESFNLYKSVTLSLTWLNKDFVIMSSGFYQVVILIYCIFLTCNFDNDSDDLKVLFRLFVTGALIWIFLYFSVIIEEMVARVSTILN
jgi:hypothetical protein